LALLASWRFKNIPLRVFPLRPLRLVCSITPHPGGMSAISRWLSEATPPDHRQKRFRIPEGCQPDAPSPFHGSLLLLKLGKLAVKKFLPPTPPRCPSVAPAAAVRSNPKKSCLSSAFIHVHLRFIPLLTNSHHSRDSRLDFFNAKTPRAQRKRQRTGRGNEPQMNAD
jgi:hypothetical protein